MREPKYIYIRDSKGLPVACLAFSKAGNTLTYGLSVHNPLDKFNKTLARTIARGRLLKRPRAFTYGTTPSLKELLNAFMVALTNNRTDALTNGNTKRLMSAARNYLHHTSTSSL